MSIGSELLLAYLLPNPHKKLSVKNCCEWICDATMKKAKYPYAHKLDVDGNSDQLALTLYIFSDNVADHATTRTGSNSALIRKYNQYGRHKNLPMSAGIPTGWVPGFGNGFRSLYAIMKNCPYTICTAKYYIDKSLSALRKMLRKHPYEKLMYPADPRRFVKDGSHTLSMLGVGVFSGSIGDDVLSYITKKIHEVGKDCKIPVVPNFYNPFNRNNTDFSVLIRRYINMNKTTKTLAVKKTLVDQSKKLPPKNIKPDEKVKVKSKRRRYETLRIFTYNVMWEAMTPKAGKGGKLGKICYTQVGKCRRNVLNAIQNSKADLIALQETPLEISDIIQTQFLSQYYCEWHQSGKEGQMTLLKKGTFNEGYSKSTFSIRKSDNNRKGRPGTAIEFPSGLVFINIHAPRWSKSPEIWERRISEAVEKTWIGSRLNKSKHIIIAGDFNAYASNIRIKNVPLHNASGKSAKISTYRGSNKRRLVSNASFDQIFTNLPIARKSVALTETPFPSSDHVPVICSLKVPR